MPEGCTSYDVGIAPEGDATPGDGLAEGGEVGEAPVGDGLVGQRPEVFGRLQFRGVRRLEDEAYTIGRGDAIADMPTGVVQLKDNGLVRTGANLAGEGFQGGLESLDIDGVEQEPHHLATGRADEAVEVEPLEAVATSGKGPVPLGCPDPTGQRLQAEAVFVERPNLHLPQGVRRARLIHGVLEFFLNAACSSGVAERS